MKKRLLLVLLSVMMIVAATFALFACDNKEQPLPVEKATFVVSGSNLNNYEVLLGDFKDSEAPTVYDAFIQEKYVSVFKAVIHSEYFYLEEMEGLKPSATQFISIYTTMPDYTDDTTKVLTEDGTDYYWSNKGIKELPLKNGAKYLFKLESFE